MAKSARRGPKDLGLSQLRGFREVCRRGGYAAAARHLLLTTPAVWEQISALERFYGVKLLERDGSGVRPTAQGQRLLGLIDPHLVGLDSTRAALQQLDGTLPAQLTLVTNLRVLSDEVSQALVQFQGRCPGVRVRLLFTSLDEVEPRVAAGETDVAFTLDPGPDRPRPEGVTYEPAGKVGFLLAAKVGHPLLKRPGVSLAQVVKYPLVLGEPGAYTRRRFEELLHRHALNGAAKLAVETSSDEYTLSCVRAGLGVGVSVGTGRGHLYKGLGVRSLAKWLGAARVGFLWQNGAHVTPAPKDTGRRLAVGPGSGMREGVNGPRVWRWG